jgi:hypothetical protein
MVATIDAPVATEAGLEGEASAVPGEPPLGETPGAFEAHPTRAPAMSITNVRSHRDFMSVLLLDAQGVADWTQ